MPPAKFDTREIRVPPQLLAADISGTALRVWIALRKFANDSWKAWPSKQTLLMYLPHLYPHHLVRAFKELKRAQCLEIEHRFKPDTGGQTTNAYVLKVPTIKKIYEVRQRVKSAQGGTKGGTPGVPRAVPPLYIRTELNTYNMNLKRASAEKFGRPPIRLKSRQTNGTGSKSISVIRDYVQRMYQARKGQRMPLAGRSEKILAAILKLGESKAKALYDLWWEKGRWSDFASRSGHSLEAFDRCIDSLLDDPRLPALTKRHQGQVPLLNVLVKKSL